MMVSDEGILTLSDEEDDMEEMQRVVWSETCKIHYFNIHRKAPLRKIFEEMGAEQGLKPEEIALLKNGTKIYPQDSIHSLNISILDQLVAFKKTDKDEEEDLLSRATGKIKIKVQHKDKRQPQDFYLRPSQPFKDLIQACAKQFQTETNLVKIKFEGDLVRPNDSPQSLDIEDDVLMELFT